jgi:imidazole glycerol phosphate synthase glutamine amidotransferase subunit
MAAPRIAVLSLGCSNAANIGTGLRRAGGDPFPMRTPGDLSRARALVIPGVANVAYLIEALDAAKLREPLTKAMRDGMPALGICAGFQLCFEGSDEAPGDSGLGIFTGRVRAMRARKIPHAGWNRVSSLVPDFESGWASFAHSFAVPADAAESIAVTQHDEWFASAGRRGNVLGVQFHPERSGAFGAALLAGFVRRAATC